MMGSHPGYILNQGKKADPQTGIVIHPTAAPHCGQCVHPDCKPAPQCEQYCLRLSISFNDWGLAVGGTDRPGGRVAKMSTRWKNPSAQAMRRTNRRTGQTIIRKNMRNPKPNIIGYLLGRFNSLLLQSGF